MQQIGTPIESLEVGFGMVFCFSLLSAGVFKVAYSEYTENKEWYTPAAAGVALLGIAGLAAFNTCALLMEHDTTDHLA